MECSANTQCPAKCPVDALCDAALEGDLQLCQQLAANVTDAAAVLATNGALACAFANNHDAVCVWLIHHFRLNRARAAVVMKNYAISNMTAQLARASKLASSSRPTESS